MSLWTFTQSPTSPLAISTLLRAILGLSFCEPWWYDHSPTPQSALSDTLSDFDHPSWAAMLRVLSNEPLVSMSEGQLEQMVAIELDDLSVARNLDIYRHGTTYRELLDFTRDWLRAHLDDIDSGHSSSAPS